MSPRIAIVMPAFNEARTMGAVLRSVVREMPKADIVVIDDASSDKTADVARHAGAKVISLPFNMGYGIALQTGFKYAYKHSYDYVVQMDSDGQHDPASIHALLEGLKNGDADVVIGSRFLGLGNYRAPFMRRLGMKFFGAIASILVRKKISDPTSGFQALNKHAIRFNASDYYPVDFPDADYIIMLHRAGLKVKEVPVEMHQSPAQKKSMHAGWRPIYYVFDMLLSILVVLLRKHEFKREVEETAPEHKE
jgi:hypothetical protein